jgi:hypothetical protein
MYSVLCIDLAVRSAPHHESGDAARNKGSSCLHQAFSDTMPFFFLSSSVELQPPWRLERNPWSPGALWSLVLTVARPGAMVLGSHIREPVISKFVSCRVMVLIFHVEC